MKKKWPKKKRREMQGNGSERKNTNKQGNK